jgi:DNA repair exonuclease SbcCD ATPase subunit
MSEITLEEVATITVAAHEKEMQELEELMDAREKYYWTEIEIRAEAYNALRKDFEKADLDRKQAWEQIAKWVIKYDELVEKAQCPVCGIFWVVHTEENFVRHRATRNRQMTLDDIEESQSARLSSPGSPSSGSKPEGATRADTLGES